MPESNGVLRHELGLQCRPKRAEAECTLAERYLAGRGILLTAREACPALPPGCYCRDLVSGETLTFAALIAVVTNLDGRITGLQRTWLDPAGDGKTQLIDPLSRSWRRAKDSNRWLR